MLSKVRRWIRLTVFLYLTGWFIGSFWLIAVLRSGGGPAVFAGVYLGPVKPYLYYGLAGAIGGTLYALRILHEYFYRVSFRWLYWYALRPILCAGAAMMTIVLFQSGIMLLQVGGSLNAKIGIAFLVGYGFGKFMDKMRMLTEALLNGKSDSSGSGKEQVK